MNTFITYLIATTVSLGIFYVAYAMLLRKEPLFRFNRMYLLSSLIFAYLIPLVVFVPELFTFSFLKSSTSGIIYSVTLAPVEITANASKNPSVFSFLGYIYIAGLVYFAGRLISRIVSIYKLGSSSERTNSDKITILWSKKDIPPFSFFRSMYLPTNLKENPHLNEIIRHEQVHINSLHSYDIILTQLIQTVFWFNPFIPLVEKSLREIHEFEADKAVIRAGTDPVAYTKILFAQDKTALAVVLGNNFNYSLIKRRLTMFYKKSTRFARLKAAVVLSLAVCTAMFYAVACNQTATKDVSNLNDSIGKVTMVMDSLGKQTGKVEISTSTVPPSPPPPPKSGVATVPPPPPPPPPPPSVRKSSNEGPVYTIVKPMPQFPGGDEARNKYIANTVKYPAEAIAKGIQGTVYISFIVEKDGSIGEVKVLRGIEKSCDAEAVRTVSNMPKWSPGLYKGKPVRVLFNMPIYYKLN